MENQLGYRNEDDKCYGATGMTVGLVVFNGEEMLSAVSLDAAPGNMMEMHDEFYFSGNPRLSASVVWRTMFQNFGLSVAMLISNVMCRRLILDRGVVEQEIKAMLAERVAQEGLDSCGLEEDESRRVFERAYSNLYRVFSHRGVQSVARDFAETLKRRRHLSRFEVLEELRALNSL